ncbi:snoRNA-binding protein NHP2 [Rhodotorula paludigena]|uniref:H/ACA ribonucleoprotein complex subunit 2 n=1 Tax=Rhodotorula paludigena TaxID=86838 RepID=A0AAV5GW35_9BASI|nr:hypothetical protein Rhopal_005836-T1 [Rhodotorula paludigena]
MGKSSKRTLDEAAPASDAPAAMEVDAASPSKKSKKDKKDKKDKSAAGADAEDKEVSADQLAEIAKPLAVKKTGKHVLKLVKRASKSRHLKRGVKEVVKSIRKGEKGIVVLAADISPLDILTHIPLLAEEANCPYIWVTSKESLGLASSTKRPTSCVMVAQQGMKRKQKEGEEKKDESKAKEAEKEFQENYDEVKKEVEALEVAVPTY